MHQAQPNYKALCSKIMYVQHFGAHIKVQDVTFADIDRLHRKITARGHLHRANRTIAVVSKMFALAVRWAMRPDNPCKHVERNQETQAQALPVRR